MKKAPVIPMLLIGMTCVVLSLPSGAFALPKSSSKNCSIKDTQTRFGASCVDQAAQDIATGKPYTHVLFCGGDTMLCCTVSESTGEVINCRKPAGSSLMQRGNSQPGAILGRGVEGEESDELTTVPAWVKEAAPKGR